MCGNHHGDFDEHRFFIRWEQAICSYPHHLVLWWLEPLCSVPTFRLHQSLPLRLRQTLPWSDTILWRFHRPRDMRVRGRYPYIPDYADRPIGVPPKWQRWITNAPDAGMVESVRPAGIVVTRAVGTVVMEDMTRP